MRVLLKQRPQLNKKQVEGIFYISLMMLSLFAFLFLGADGYVLFDDSGSYINCLKYVEGVMPIYPLFLNINRVLFGETYYLNAVVIEQAFYASACIIFFVRMVKEQFGLKYWETYCVFGLSFFPFIIDLPDTMITQQILTEGIAYATFYIFMGVLLKTVWMKRLEWFLALFLITFVLAATRSQLQILFGVCGIIFFYVVLTRRKMSVKQRVISFCGGIAGCLLISLFGVWSINRTSALYQEVVRNIGIKIEAEEAKVELEQNVVSDIPESEKTEATETKKPESTSQYVTLLFSRGMYEADYEDYELFQDEELKELYIYFYQIAEENECRYVYAEPGLWMWKDIVGGIGSVGSKCFYALDGHVNGSDMLTIGITLIKEHWSRFLYHTLMLLPQAFISTIFFQVESVYFLCHVITLFLYLSAIGLMIWAFADKKVDRAFAEFMATVLGTNVVMVVIISLVFFGQQRYLVYSFGFFYIIYFLLLLQMWKIYGKNWLRKWVKKEKF